MTTNPWRYLRFAAFTLVALIGLGIGTACLGSSDGNRDPAPPRQTASPAGDTELPSPTANRTPVTRAPAPDGCTGSGRRICLVPLADFATPSVDSLVQHLAGLGIPAGSVPAVRLEISDIDRTRLQLGGRGAVSRVDAAYPDLVADPDVTMIALTDLDIFIEDQTYNWVFGMRGSGSLLISTSRMYEEFWGAERDDALRDSRLRKMLLRYVGLFHLDLPENDYPLTVLYRNLDSLSSLDAMREGILLPAELPQPTSDVGRWAVDFCLPSEHLAADIYRAGVNARRSFNVELSVDDARISARDYLDAWQIARAEYVDFLEGNRPLAQATASEAIIAFDDALQTLLRSTTVEFDTAIADIEQLNTTAAIAGRIYELSITLWTDPAAIALSEAYDSLPLGVLVALGDVGPCGGFAPQVFFTEPSV